MEEAARARRKARTRRLLALALALAAAFALTLAAPPRVARAEGAGVPVYRLYNRWSGEHLFTTDKSEYESLQGLGWSGEGEAWTSPSEGDTVFRLYNPYSGDHHYTMDQGEYDGLGRIGWRQEGRVFFSADASRGVPVYRLFNRWLTQGTHLFTGDEGEYDGLGRIGWQQEGVAFYAMGGGPFTVRFISWDDSEGREVTVSEKTLAAGERISVPESPARDGYEFRGWGDGVEDGMACTRDATYEAQWAPVSPADYTTDDGAEVSGVSFSEDVRASENGVVNSVSDDGTLSVTVPAGEVGDLVAGNVLVLGKDDVASGIAVRVSSIKTNPDGSATVSGSVPDDLSEVVDSIDVSYDGPLQVDDPVYGSGVTEGADIDRSSLHAAELDGDAGGEAIPLAAPRPLRELSPAADVPFDFNATVDIGEADGSLTKSQIRSMRSKLKNKSLRKLTDDDIDKIDEDTLSWLSDRHAVKPKGSGKLKVAASGTLHIRFSFRNGDVDNTVFVDDASALFGFDGSVKGQLPIHLIAGYVGPVLLDLDVKFEAQGSANAMFGIEGFAFGVDETGTYQASRGHVRYGVPEGKVGFSAGLSGGAMLGVYGVASVDGELYGGGSADGAITPRRDAKACADLSIRPMCEATVTVSLVPMKSKFSVDPFKNMKASLHLEGELTDLGSWKRVSACTWKVVYEGDDFEFGERDGRKYVNYCMHFPRSSNRIVAVFIKITRIDGTVDYSSMVENDWKRLEVYSGRNNAYFDKEKRERVERPNELYTSTNGGIDPGFLKAKCIKHAFDTYPKLRIGKGSVLESQTIDEPQPSFDPYAGAADDTDNSQEQQEQQQEQQQAANDSFATTANPPAGITINTNAGATDDVW